MRVVPFREKRRHTHDGAYRVPHRAFTIAFMADRLFRVHIGLTTAQLRALDALAKKLLLDRSNVMRLALARLVEAENRNPDSHTHM
jgi:hypothetical protein